MPLREEPFRRVVVGTCQCGRVRARLHCPACGSLNIYATSRGDDFVRSAEQADVIYKALGFKCRRCGVYFSEATECEAPPPATVARTRKLAEVEASSRALLDKHAGNKHAVVDELFSVLKKDREQRGKKD